MLELKNNLKNVEITENKKNDVIFYNVNFLSTISKEELIENLKIIYNKEKEEDFKDKIIINFKSLDLMLITEAIKYSLNREDLQNPIMLLNIINLIKIFNTCDESYFENENVFVSSIEDMIDLKIHLKNELNEFKRKLSIYFISLFKSYNKITYSSLDYHQELPNIYKSCLLSLDMLSLSGIFATSPVFSTEECVYIDDAFKYVQQLLIKNAIGINLMNEFFEGIENGNTTK